MTNEPQKNELCPCDSGLLYAQCCGTPDRAAVNAEILATISENRNDQNNLTPQLRKALDSITTLPDFFPARINFFDDKAFFVKMSPRWYSESVFLDPARIKGTCVIQTDLNWLRTATDQIPWLPATMIFHTAFCGSTLMAQALDALFNCLPLREPEVLGNVLFYINAKNPNAQNGDKLDKETWLERVMRLLSRRYEPQQGVVIKANDYANPLMIDLLQWRKDLPLLFMYTPLKEFLAGCLKAENRHDWIRGRYKAIATVASGIFDNQAITCLDDNSLGEMAAVYWSYNIALYYKAWQLSEQNIHSLDFNTMLAKPLPSIEACGKLFGLQPRSNVDPANEIDKLLGVYSKNSKFKYSPQQRFEDIQRTLDKYTAQSQSAECLARHLLQKEYPDDGLPGGLQA
jgi:hypothetical protein